VEKNLSGVKTDYLYDLANHVITAFQSAGTWQRGEIYAGGWHLGTYYPNATYFSLTDWLGTEHYRTDNLGNLYQTCYNLPFGDGQTCAGTDVSPLHFTGKERDSESGLDNLGARFYSSVAGRFPSTDPIIANAFRMINPQRWNQYSYAINNPLAFTDPDGKDAGYVIFKGMAHGYGHAGILSIHRSNGSATYSRFGPASAGSPLGKGEVQTDHELPSVEFGSDGLPTPASYASLAVAVAQFENVDPSTVGILYFKTSEADTRMLDQFILQKQSASDKGTIGLYFLKGNNCADYAMQGLVAGGALDKWRVGFMPATPNDIFSALNRLADSSFELQGTREEVTHTIRPADDTEK